MGVDMQDVGSALAGLGRLRFGEMKVEDAMHEPPRLPRLSGTPPLVIDRLRHCVGVAPPGRGRPKSQSPQLIG